MLVSLFLSVPCPPHLPPFYLSLLTSYLHDSMPDPTPSQHIFIPPFPDRRALNDPPLFNIYIHRASFRLVSLRLRSGQSPFPRSPRPLVPSLCFIFLERLASKSTVSKSADPILPLNRKAEKHSFQVFTPRFLVSCNTTMMGYL